MRPIHFPVSSTELVSNLLLASSVLTSTASALQFPQAPASNIDYSQLGRVAFAGDFAGASLFQYTQESQSTFSSNGSQSLLSRFPSGAFATLQSSDAHIQTMCALQDGSRLVGVLIGGNFTSLGGVESPGLALFDPNSSKVTAIKGVSGQVNALYCDNSNGTAYIGGSFSALNNSNAVAWTSSGLKQLPFIGLNGAVTSIVKSSDGNIVFGGQFDGLGNATTPAIRNSQRIPLTSGNFSAVSSSSQGGLSDPKNIICKDPNSDGPNNAWLLADNTPGSLTGNFEFGFNPTLLRLRNTNFQGRGTKTWRYTAIPLNGIMNFSYVDENNHQQYCDSECPLPQGGNQTRDYTFVNSVGMTGFRLDISAWYGAGGGLSDVELYQEDIYTFSINSFNEPQCNGVQFPARSQTTGTWTQKPFTASGPPYLSTQLQGSVGSNSSNIVFFPDIKQSGNYSVTIYTPGCIADGSCSSRGRVTLTGNVATGNGNATGFSTEVAQTNFYDKYDQIFLGHVDATSDSFKPSVTLAPTNGQNGPLTVVAQRVRFELVSTSGGLNGLFEFNPRTSIVDMNFRKSTVDSSATSLDSGAQVNAIVSTNNLIYVGGSFRSGQISNFFAVGNNAPTVPNRGLNGAVQTLYANGNNIYVGGSFSGNSDSGGPSGLGGIAIYNTGSNSWSAVGAGVRGNVSYIVPFQLNIGGSRTSELALAVSGQFDQLVGFNNAGATPANNFGVWVPGRSNWLANLNVATISVNGVLTSTADVPNNPAVFGGSVSSFDIAANGAVEISSSNLQTLPLRLAGAAAQRSNSSSTNTTGIQTGLFYNQNKRNLVVLGGRFSAVASNGSTVTDLAIIDSGNSNSVSGVTIGLTADSTVRAVDIVGNSLFAGGSLSGNVHGNSFAGLFVYDISTNDFAGTQPPALQGNNLVVQAIAAAPNSQSVYVGGNFASAGNLACAGLCVYDNSRSQWATPGSGLSGTVSSLVWADQTHLLVAGNLTVNGTTSPLALFDSSRGTYSAAANTNAPQGTVTALSAGNSNGSAAWVGGHSSDGTPFLSKYDGFKWTNVSGLGNNSDIRDLQIFTLTSDHGDSALLDKNNVLALFGNIVIPNYGNASAALYNGTTFTPFLLTNTASNNPGSVNSLFVSNSLNFFKGGHHLAVGFIVLIGLALSLGLVFLLIAIGILASVIRRRRQGYVAAPSPVDNDNLQRIPPQELLGGVVSRPGTQSGRGWSTKQEEVLGT